MNNPPPRLDRLLSARDAEKLLGIPRATIRSWDRRRRATGLKPAGLDDRSVPLYRAIDLVRLRRGERIRHDDGEWIEP